MSEYIRFTSNAYSKCGTLLSKESLLEILSICYQIPKDKRKGMHGSIFVYDSDVLGEHDEDLLSTGIILCDIDWLTKEQCDIIYNGFDKLCDRFKPLLAIQYSASYYDDTKEKNGLHFFVKSYPINKLDYEIASSICLGIIAELIQRLFGIDLVEQQKKTGNIILDFHNTSMYQRFNLYYSTYKHNEDAEEYDERLIKLDDLVYIQNKYKIKFEKETPQNTTYFGGYKIKGYGWNKKTTKKKIDRYFNIGSYSGNDIRWRISVISENLFGDNAKEFCDANFYYENNKSIFKHYSKFEEMSINPIIMKWLIENDYVYKNEELEINEWINEWHDYIIKRIESNPRHSVMIDAPTGSGKTFYVNNLLAKKLNAVVVSPFNTNLHLYDNCFYVDSSYKGNIPKSQPVSIIWDQFIKRQNEFEDRYIIVDESHTLFFDREYRDSAIKMLEYLKRRNNKIICISATPAGEKDILNLEELTFTKKKNPIEMIIFKNINNHELFIFNYIKKCIDNNLYDYIVFFSDSLAKKVYENFIIRGYGDKISYLRSSTKDCKDFVDIREKEMIDKPLTITTCVAYNGLNFKNKDKRVLTIGEIIEGRTTSNEIIQQLGRFRFSKVKGIYTYVKKSLENIDAREEKADEMIKLYAKGVDDMFLQYDKRYLDKEWVSIKREINEYNERKANIDAIVKEISETGYIHGKVIDKEEDDKFFLRLELKRQESDKMKEDILNDTFINKEYNTEYSKKWSEAIHHIISNPIYKGIDLDDIKSIIKNSTKQKLIENIIGEVKDTIRIIGMPDKEYNDFIQNINTYKNMLKNETDKRDFGKRVNHVKKIREQYKNKIRLEEKEVLLHDMITDIISSEYENAKQNLSMGAPKKKIQDLSTGIIYDSVTDCAQSIGHNITYISKHKDRFKFI